MIEKQQHIETLNNSQYISPLTHSFTFNRTMIMINNSVFDESLGAVNGLGQSMAALARTIGPAIGGLLWSISLEVRHVYVYSNI